ncbi:class I SAM-dependent methyltransferase [Halobacillus sp. A5]|uniref:class I SAM-dependent DNA methyltransferase n=1 Tax=Halobacillus sp. A5 TaxID=2880263 RepID=UPI0020A692BD|nr:class I SAM-dependent methyltransferase [Halobacillus sp. A5]MCP3028877.1 methyltransferase domain-containing protein [Halobacillus sp. A5]
MKEFEGASVYDQIEFFSSYLNKRNCNESPNQMIEEPVFVELLGNVAGKDVVDLGCGDGRFGRQLLERGCGTYLGVDNSANMLKEAEKNLENTVGKVVRSSLEEWCSQETAFDLVISRLALHYIDNLLPLLCRINKALREGGRFIFTVQHPVLTASMRSAQKEGRRTDWIVDDYFFSGKRSEPWMGQQVVKYHRTFEEYFQLLNAAGFEIKDVREGKPDPFYFTEEEYKRRARIPLFLMISCVKPGGQ